MDTAQTRHPAGTRQGGRFAPTSRPTDISRSLHLGDTDKTLLEVPGEYFDIHINLSNPDQPSKPSLLDSNFAMKFYGSGQKVLMEYSMLLSSVMGHMLQTEQLASEEIPEAAQAMNDLVKVYNPHVRARSVILACKIIMNIRELAHGINNSHQWDTTSAIHQSLLAEKSILLPGLNVYTDGTNFEWFANFGFCQASASYGEFNRYEDELVDLYNRSLALGDASRDMSNIPARKVLVAAWRSANRHPDKFNFKTWCERYPPAGIYLLLYHLTSQTPFKGSYTVDLREIVSIYGVLNKMAHAKAAQGDPTEVVLLKEQLARLISREDNSDPQGNLDYLKSMYPTDHPAASDEMTRCDMIIPYQRLDPEDVY